MRFSDLEAARHPPQPLAPGDPAALFQALEGVVRGIAATGVPVPLVAGRDPGPAMSDSG